MLGATNLAFQNVSNGFAPLASPVFIDRPKAPTPDVFSNDTTLATTEYVQRALGSYAGQTNYDGDKQLTVSDIGKLTIFTVPATATLPDWTTVPPGGLVTIFSTAGVTVKTRSSETLGTQNGTQGFLPIAAQTMAVFRRLLLAPGWSLDTGDAALKYSPLFKSSLKASGYQANPSGMLDQWGIGQADASGNVYVTFPISFPVGFSSIVGNHEGGDIAVVILASGSQTKQGAL